MFVVVVCLLLSQACPLCSSPPHYMKYQYVKGFPVVITAHYKVMRTCDHKELQ